MSTAWGLLLGILTSGCFVYRHTDLAGVGVTDEVRVALTGDAARRITADFGVAGKVEGRLTSLGTDSLALAVRVPSGYGGSEFPFFRYTIPVRTSEILAIERRQFSIKRTTFMALGIAAFAAVLLDRLGIIEPPWADDDGPPSPPPPEELRLPARWR